MREQDESASNVAAVGLHARTAPSGDGPGDGNGEISSASDSAPPAAPPRRRGALAVLAAVACAVFGAKLIAISALGSPMPLLDQWDAEAASLYSPYLKGTLAVANLFAPHLDHRIFLTRVLALVHLELAGEWNARLEMILDAIVHTAVVTWLAALLMPLVAPQRRILLGCFVAFLFVFPIAYENTLCGFQSQVYFTLLFGIAALVGFADARAFSWRWFGGLAAASLSYLSYSLGVATILAAGVLVGLQLASNVRKRSGREFAAVGLMGALAAATILWAASSAHPMSTLSTFIQGLLVLLALAGVGLVPVAWFCYRTVARRPDTSDRTWVVVGIGAWIAIQFALLAYGRGNLIAVRYVDVVLLVYPVALVAIFALADISRVTRFGRRLQPHAGLWVFTVVTAVGVLGYYGTTVGAAGWSKSAQQQLVNVQAYLATRDAGHLKPTGAHGYSADLSYPNPQRLAATLEDRDLRTILPPELRPADADNAAAHNRMWLKGSLAGGTAAAVRLLLSIGPALLALGVGLFFAAGTRRRIGSISGHRQSHVR